jgi:hypothetical protein
MIFVRASSSPLASLQGVVSAGNSLLSLGLRRTEEEKLRNGKRACQYRIFNSPGLGNGELDIGDFGVSLQRRRILTQIKIWAASD